MMYYSWHLFGCLVATSSRLDDSYFNSSPRDALVVHHGGSFFRVPLVHEPDHSGSPVLHLRVLDLSAVRESLPEDLPVAVWGQVADHNGVGGGSWNSAAATAKVTSGGGGNLWWATSHRSHVVHASEAIPSSTVVAAATHLGSTHGPAHSCAATIVHWSSGSHATAHVILLLRLHGILLHATARGVTGVAATPGQVGGESRE